MQPFSMHKVLKHRSQQEEIAQQAFFHARKEEERIVHEIIQKKEEYQTLQQDHLEKTKEGVTVDTFIIFENRMALLRKQIDDLIEQQKRQQVRVNEKQRALLRASRNKKALEKVKEKQDSSYQAFLNQKENSQLDEFAILFHNRRE